MEATKDPRKGVDLLLTALAKLCHESSLQYLALVFGQLAPQLPPQLGFPGINGHLYDDLVLRRFL